MCLQEYIFIALVIVINKIEIVLQFLMRLFNRVICLKTKNNLVLNFDILL